MNAALVALVVAALSIGVSQSPSSSSDQSGAARELEDIEHQLAKAWLKGDQAFVEGVLADEWTVTDFAGQGLTRRQVLDEGFVSRDRRITSAKMEDLRVRIFGDSAVVTGKSSISGEYRGKSARVVTRFTDVFIRREGRWQVVASQATRIAE